MDNRQATNHSGQQDGGVYVHVREKLNVCVCASWCVCPMVFNFSAGPFCRAPQDKLPCMAGFERQCSAWRKGQGWNTGNRPIKIHHFDPGDLSIQGGCKHTGTLMHLPKLLVKSNTEMFWVYLHTLFVAINSYILKFQWTAESDASWSL